MKHRAIRTARRLAITMAVGVGAGVPLAVATPAQALGNCSPDAWSYSIDGAQNITAIHGKWCDDGQTWVPMTAWVSRYVSPGVWTTVAQGMSPVTYYCQGHAYNVYKVGPLSQFADTCG